MRVELTVRLLPGRKIVMRAEQGDWLIVESLHTGEVRRRGQVLEVHGPDGTPPFLIRWNDDDHESLVFPGPDAHVEKAENSTQAGLGRPITTE